MAAWSNLWRRIDFHKRQNFHGLGVEPHILQPTRFVDSAMKASGWKKASRHLGDRKVDDRKQTDSGRTCEAFYAIIESKNFKVYCIFYPGRRISGRRRCHVIGLEKLEVSKNVDKSDVSARSRYPAPAPNHRQFPPKFTRCFSSSFWHLMGRSSRVSSLSRWEGLYAPAYKLAPITGITILMIRCCLIPGRCE